MNIASIAARLKGAFGFVTAEQSVTGVIEFSGPDGTLRTGPQVNRLMQIMQAGAADANMLVVGDSTGNGSDEWVYLFAQWLGSIFPSYTVDYRLWGTADYSAAVVLQTGTGSKKLTVYNASVSGTNLDYFTAGRFNAAVRDIPLCDLVVINHGHNALTRYSTESVQLRRVPDYVCGVLQILRVQSSADLVFMSQNPRRDDDNYALQYAAIIDAANLLGAQVADSYQLFARAGKPSGWYADNIHPNATGTLAYLSAIQGVMYRQSRTVENSLNVRRGNLLSNGDFSVFSGAVPDGWTASGATTSKNTSQVDGVNGYSVTVTATGAAQSQISQSLSAAQLSSVKGHWLTLAVRLYVAAGQPGTSGRIALTSTSQNANSNTMSGDARDGFTWRVLSLYVAPSDGYVTVRLYGDTGTTQGVASFDRAILVRGRLPADVI